jgi:hypothetical protein
MVGPEQRVRQTRHKTAAGARMGPRGRGGHQAGQHCENSDYNRCHVVHYSGIDLLYYGNGEELEYDFLVVPGADAVAIRIAFEDNTASLDVNGDLAIKEPSTGEEVRLRKPVAYQVINGIRREVAAKRNSGMACRAAGPRHHRVVNSRIRFGEGA